MEVRDGVRLNANDGKSSLVILDNPDKCSVSGVTREYTAKVELNESVELVGFKYLGVGTVLNDETNTLYHLWEKVEDIDSNPALDIEFKSEDIGCTTIDSCEEIKGESEDLGDIVRKEIYGEEKMETKKLTKEDILKVVRDNKDSSVDVVIDYCKLRIADGLNAALKGDGMTEATAAQNDIVSVMAYITENGLISNDSKERIITALEKENDEYVKLQEMLEAANEEALKQSKKSLGASIKDGVKSIGSHLNRNKGKYALAVVGVVSFVAALRYLDPKDVVITIADTASDVA